MPGWGVECTDVGSTQPKRVRARPLPGARPDRPRKGHPQCFQRLRVVPALCAHPWRPVPTARWLTRSTRRLIRPPHPQDGPDGHGGHHHRGAGLRQRPCVDGRGHHAHRRWHGAQRTHRQRRLHPRRPRLLGERLRRRHLHLRRCSVLRLDRLPAAQSPDRRHRRPPRTGAATGRWPATAASSPSAMPDSTDRPVRWSWPVPSSVSIRHRTMAATGWWHRTVASSPSVMPPSTVRPARCRRTAPSWVWLPPLTDTATGKRPPTAPFSPSGTPGLPAWRRPARRWWASAPRGTAIGWPPATAPSTPSEGRPSWAPPPAEVSTGR